MDACPRPREKPGCRTTAKVRSMTDEQLAAMHRLLAEYHRKLAKEAVLDVVQQYHADHLWFQAQGIDDISPPHGPAFDDSGVC
jgi:hypothetical protein